MKYRMLAGGLALAILASGCAFGTPTPAAPAAAGIGGSSERAAPEAPDPQSAVEAVYAQESLSEVLSETIDQNRMLEILVSPDFEAEELYARYSDPRNGLADIVIAKPVKGDEEKMINWLYRYQERRVTEFENYDILDSHAIAQSAVVYQQGEYIVLLMLPDNEAAQYIIDQYIPQ